MNEERKKFITDILLAKKITIESFKGIHKYSFNNQPIGIRIVNNTLLSECSILEPELQEILFGATDVKKSQMDIFNETQKLEKLKNKEKERIQKQKERFEKHTNKIELQSGEEISYDLAEMNIMYDTSVPRWIIPNEDPTMGVMKINTDEICAKIRFHREMCGKPPMNKNNILDYMIDVECTERMRILSKFKPTIKFDNTITVEKRDELFVSLARQISQSNYNAMYPIILRHMIWTVKRRLYDMTDYCPILINFYSDAGGAKTESINLIFSIFPEMLKSSGVNASDMFEDDRFFYMFTDNYILIMNELTGMNKADISSLKNIIDQKIINYRMLGYNRSSKGKNCAQLFGSSNARIRNLVIADKDVRKWCEIDFYAFPDNEINEKMIEPLKKFDWLSLWRSVDENSDSPFHDGNVYKQYRKWVNETCVTKTPTVEWITNFILTQHKLPAGDVRHTEDGHNKMLCSKLWESYKDSLDDEDSRTQGKSKFLDLLLGYKFIKLTRQSDGYYYKIPKPEECPYIENEDIKHFKIQQNEERDLTVEDLL